MVLLTTVLLSNHHQTSKLYCDVLHWSPRSQSHRLLCYNESGRCWARTAKPCYATVCQDQKLHARKGDISKPKKPAATPNAFHVNATTNYWIHIFFHSTKSKARFSHVPIWVFPRHLPAAYESLKVLLRPQRVVAPCWSKTSSWTWPGFELVAALPAAATNPDAEREWSTSVIRWPRWCFHNLSALWNSARWNCADVVN